MSPPHRGQTIGWMAPLRDAKEDTAAIHFELVCRSAHDALLVSFRALLPLCASLPRSGGQVLVTDLNCSESREGRTAAASYRLPPGLRPEPGQLAAVAPKLVQTRREYSPVEMLKTPVGFSCAEGQTQAFALYSDAILPRLPTRLMGSTLAFSRVGLVCLSVLLERCHHLGLNGMVM
jgi:hypothetical protein